MFSLTIWSRQRVAPCYFLRPSRLEQRNRATRRDRMAALTPTPVPPEAILVGPLPPNCNVQTAICYVRFTSTPAVSFAQIALKNSEIEGRGKSRLHAPSVVYASRCHSKAYERVARSKAGRSAEPLRKFPLRLPAVL